MVAYSFQKRFAEPILAGTKGQTIRAFRKRHARPGEELQLFIGMRTKHCRLIARKECLAVDPITLVFATSAIFIGDRVVAGNLVELDIFARFDGFESYAAMRQFWRDEHDEGDHWEGTVIRWLPLPEGVRA
jgi:hypothetical protein